MPVKNIRNNRGQIGLTMAGKRNKSKGISTNISKSQKDCSTDEMISKATHTLRSDRQLSIIALVVLVMIATTTAALSFKTEWGSKVASEADPSAEKSRRNLQRTNDQNDPGMKQKIESNSQRTEEQQKRAARQTPEELKNENKQTASQPPLYGTFEVLGTIPHEPSAFTQGLSFHNGVLYESTGNYNNSTVRKINPKTGDVLESIVLPERYFGEGLTHYDNGKKLIQLTWLEKTGFIYDANTLKVLKTFKYDNKIAEGWGITHNPDNNTFIISDGSSWLHIWNAETLEEIRKVEVTLPNKSKRPVDSLNELEWDGNGTVLANRWYRDVILRIEIATGEITTIYNFERLWPRKQRRNTRADSFNGIATTDVKGEYYVTGKLWPKMYRVKLN